ncbi:hypothetical protein ACVW0J_000477 [Bradyrhizobium sp. i1.7.7]
MRRDPAGSRRPDRGADRRRRIRFRSAATGDRHRRLSDPAAGASDGETVRRGRPLRALGRNHAGHHGYRGGAAIARRARDRRARHRRAAKHPRGPLEALPRHADGRPHPSPAGAAGDVRLQDRDLARDVRPPRRAARAIEAARAGRTVRRRRRNAGLARRQGVRGAGGALRRARAAAFPPRPGTSRATALPRP